MNKREKRLSCQGRKRSAGNFRPVILNVIFFLSFLFWIPQAGWTEECEYHKVRWVIDGDTFVIENGKKVRLIGVDTPEKGDRRRSVEFYAIEAMNFLRNTIQSRKVCLKKDPLHRQHRDRFNRLLRYVYLDNRFINRELIQKGYAMVYTTYPFSFINEFKSLEAEARANGLGIWNTEMRCHWQKKMFESMRIADSCSTDGTICPWQAGNYIGKTVRVRMFVQRVLEGREYIFLDSERDYHSPLNLRVLLPVDTPDPYKYIGRAVEVTGTVNLYQNHPELKAEKIKILTE